MIIILNGLRSENKVFMLLERVTSNDSDCIELFSSLFPRNNSLIVPIRHSILTTKYCSGH